MESRGNKLVVLKFRELPIADVISSTICSSISFHQVYFYFSFLQDFSFLLYTRNIVMCKSNPHKNTLGYQSLKISDQLCPGPANFVGNNLSCLALLDLLRRNKVSISRGYSTACGSVQLYFQSIIGAARRKGH